MTAFHTSLSPESVYHRYFETLTLSERVAHGRLARVCRPDPLQELVLVAQTVSSEAVDCIIGVARLERVGADAAEFAIVISDRFQGKGLGTELLRRLVAITRELKIARIGADILTDNLVMQRVCERQGMQIRSTPGDETVRVEMELRDSSTGASASASAPIKPEESTCLQGFPELNVENTGIPSLHFGSPELG
jgi:acetyltransferase